MKWFVSESDRYLVCLFGQSRMSRIVQLRSLLRQSWYLYLVHMEHYLVLPLIHSGPAFWLKSISFWPSKWLTSQPRIRRGKKRVIFRLYHVHATLNFNKIFFQKKVKKGKRKTYLDWGKGIRESKNLSKNLNHSSFAICDLFLLQILCVGVGFMRENEKRVKNTEEADVWTTNFREKKKFHCRLIPVV